MLNFSFIVRIGRCGLVLLAAALLFPAESQSSDRRLLREASGRYTGDFRGKASTKRFEELRDHIVRGDSVLRLPRGRGIGLNSVSYEEIAQSIGSSGIDGVKGRYEIQLRFRNVTCRKNRVIFRGRGTVNQWRHNGARVGGATVVGLVTIVVQPEGNNFRTLAPRRFSVSVRGKFGQTRINLTGQDVF